MQIEMTLLEELLAQQKKKYLKLSEFLDITQQLGDSLSRDDDVSSSMLIAMRQEPLLELNEIERNTREQLTRLPEEQAARIAGLLSGKGTVSPQQEEMQLKEIGERNFRLLQRVIELDKIINRKVAKDKSFYK